MRGSGRNGATGGRVKLVRRGPLAAFGLKVPAKPIRAYFCG
jgi:hypothetical protein